MPVRASAIVLLIGIISIAISCAGEPSLEPTPTREFPNATDAELDEACEVLSRVGYDFERMSNPWTPITQKRVVEVAAMIDWNYTGPDNVRGFCRRHSNR